MRPRSGRHCDDHPQYLRDPFTFTRASDLTASLDALLSALLNQVAPTFAAIQITVALHFRKGPLDVVNPLVLIPVDSGISSSTLAREIVAALTAAAGTDIAADPDSADLRLKIRISQTAGPVLVEIDTIDIPLFPLNVPTRGRSRKSVSTVSKSKANSRTRSHKR